MIGEELELGFENFVVGRNNGSYYAQGLFYMGKGILVEFSTRK